MIGSKSGMAVARDLRKEEKDSYLSMGMFQLSKIRKRWTSAV